jgi:methionyl-tRNA formyltransferase
MRIVFCGTPDYAVPSLKRLMALAPRHEVAAVVSQPDRPKGRSRLPSPPPVVEAARACGVPNERIFQPSSINRRSVLDPLRALAPDLLCVVAYGNLLKPDALALPKLYGINAHGSLLPRHRGAAPIQAALLAGDAETGVTIMKVELALDAGPILLKRATPINDSDDAGTLHDRLAELSAECFVEAIEQIAAGDAQFTPQDETQATYAVKLEKTSGQIDWTKDADYLDRFVRAMNPWPGAWTRISGDAGKESVRLRVAKAHAGCAMTVLGPAGRAGANGVELRVACGSGELAITAVQPEGKREMSGAEFMRGAGRNLGSEMKCG